MHAISYGMSTCVKKYSFKPGMQTSCCCTFHFIHNLDLDYIHSCWALEGNSLQHLLPFHTHNNSTFMPWISVHAALFVLLYWPGSTWFLRRHNQECITNCIKMNKNEILFHIMKPVHLQSFMDGMGCRGQEDSYLDSHPLEIDHNYIPTLCSSPACMTLL